MSGELRCIVCGDTEDIDPDTRACDSCSRKYADTVGLNVTQRKRADFRRDLEEEIRSAQYEGDYYYGGDYYQGLLQALRLFDSHFGGKI
jgi:hypothetical protein